MIVWTLERDCEEGNPDLIGVFSSPQRAAMYATLDAQRVNMWRRDSYIRIHGKPSPYPPFTPLVWSKSPWGENIWESGDYTVLSRKVH